MSGSKIYLINPPTTIPSQQSLYFPMALLTLGGALKECGTEAELWDFDLYFKKAGNLREAEFRDLIRLGVRGARSPVFGISSICSNFPMALWIAREIKACRPDALVILGGTQPSSVPIDILERFEFVDMVVVGEGEITLREMAQADFDPKRFAACPGLATRVKSKAVFGGKRPLVKNMDALPLPDYSLIDFREYLAIQGKNFLPHVEVGRGCPFQCTFCSTASMWENDFRVKSPRRILEEMEALHRNHGFTQFDFIHDNFTTSRKFVAEFCDFMAEHNKDSLRWHASSRTDCIDVQGLERMHSVGLSGLFFGIETGSERMQAIIQKNLSFERFRPILQCGNDLGVNMTTAFILGFPEENREDLDQTVQRALQYKSWGTARVFFSKLSPLTGTKIQLDYFGKLETSEQPSCTSPHYYGLPYIDALIQSHPDLFSSFYHVPHPQLSEDELTRFNEFANLLVNHKTKIGLMIVETLGMSPTELFFLWDAWARKEGIPYSDYRAFAESEFKALFKLFLTESILPPARRSHPTPALAENSLSLSPSQLPSFG